MGFPTVPRPGRRGGWKRLAGGPTEVKEICKKNNLALSAASFRVYLAGKPFWQGSSDLPGEKRAP